MQMIEIWVAVAGGLLAAAAQWWSRPVPHPLCEKSRHRRPAAEINSHS